MQAFKYIIRKFVMSIYNEMFLDCHNLDKISNPPHLNKDLLPESIYKMVSDQETISTCLYATDTVPHTFFCENA